MRLLRLHWRNIAVFVAIILAITIALLLIGFFLKVDYVSFVKEFGAAGLFLIAFLSSSVFATFPHEPAIVFALTFLDPMQVFFAAVLGSTFAAIINYWIGLSGVRRLLGFWIKREPAEEKQAEEWFKKHGSVVVFFAPWIPFVGDPLTVVAGALKMGFKKYLFYSFAGRALKTLAVIYLGEFVLKFLGFPV